MPRILFLLLFLLAPAAAQEKSSQEKSFTPLFNGKDFSGWKVPDGDNGHWKVVDGVIDYDAKSEAKGDKNLWTARNYKNFILRADWRLKTEPGMKKKIPLIQPDGTTKKDNGKDVLVDVDDVDSGIYLRGTPKAQVNLWLWNCGSGEVWGYRTDPKVSAEVRAGVTPKKKADKPQGEWNTMEITLKGDRLTVRLNGEEVIANAQLPGIPPEGPIALQHHGAWDPKTNQWKGSPSLVQFKNISILELPD